MDGRIKFMELKKHTIPLTILPNLFRKLSERNLIRDILDNDIELHFYNNVFYKWSRYIVREANPPDLYEKLFKYASE